MIFIDASKLGDRYKEGKNIKTILSKDDISKIIDTYLNKNAEDKFSVVVNYDEIKNKNYSFSTGQYFEIKIEVKEMSNEEFNNTIKEYSSIIKESLTNNINIEKEILNVLEELTYEKI